MKMPEFRREEKEATGPCRCTFERLGPGTPMVCIIHGMWIHDLRPHKQGLVGARETTETYIWGDVISNSSHAVKHSCPGGSDGTI